MFFKSRVKHRTFHVNFWSLAAAVFFFLFFFFSFFFFFVLVINVVLFLFYGYCIGIKYGLKTDSLLFSYLPVAAVEM